MKRPRPWAAFAWPWVALALAGCSASRVGPSAAQPAGPTIPPAATVAAPVPAGTDVPVPTPDSTQVVQGEIIYVRECAACHGRRGEGNPEWQVPLPDGGLRPPPHDATGHTWHHPDTDLAQIVADGSLVVAPDSRMPAFRDRLSDSEVVAVLTYIKTLWGETERSYQWERSLDRARWEGAAATPPAP